MADLLEAASLSICIAELPPAGKFVKVAYHTVQIIVPFFPATSPDNHHLHFAASQWWKVVLVAAAAASIVDVFVFSRISSGTARGFALAMALTGDFGEVGARRSASSVRPAIKKQAAIEMEGEVAKALPNAMFQVALDNGCQVLAHISGKIRRNRIEIFQGDRVKVEISPYDLTRGRITHRNKRGGQGPTIPGGPAPPGGAPAPASMRNST